MKTRPTVTIYPEDVLAHSELMTFERAQAFLNKYGEAIADAMRTAANKAIEDMSEGEEIL